MEIGRAGHSGLYTMHFSNLFPSEPSPASTITTSTTTHVVPSSPSVDDIDAATPPAAVTTAAALSSSPLSSSQTQQGSKQQQQQTLLQPYSLMQFTQWHILIRMNVENDICFVKGEAKVFSPTPSLASPVARGLRRSGEIVVSTTEPDGIPMVPVHQRDRYCHVLIEGNYRAGTSSSGSSNQDSNGGAEGSSGKNNSTNTNNNSSNNKNNRGGSRDGSGANGTGEAGAGATAASAAAVSGVSTFRLEVHLDRLEAEVLGLSEPEELRNVVLSCGGNKACGWHLGVVAITADGIPVTTPQPLRFQMKPYYGARCTYCLDPVYAVGFVCDECNVAQYCSRECMNAHMKPGQHGLLCPYLRDKYQYKSGAVTTEVSDDTPLVAWWRCLDQSAYSIIADSRHALGYAMELTIATLRSSKEYGLQYRIIMPSDSSPPLLHFDHKDGSASSGVSNTDGMYPSKSTRIALSAQSSTADMHSSDNNGSDNSEDDHRAVVIAGFRSNCLEGAAHAARLPTKEEIVDFSCVLLREVNRAAILDGCISLAAACLDHLYVFSPSPEITIQSHVLFFTAFHCDEFDGPISTVEEYVSHARPLHALAILQMEYALKSAVAAEFWRRIKIAKDVIISLFTVNAGNPCAELEEMRPVVAQQQCETLTLLCKVFVLMASRAPQDEVGRWLEQGEKCLRQCCESEAVKRNHHLNAIQYFRLAALMLLYRNEAKTEESRQMRIRGEVLMRVHQSEMAAAAGGAKTETNRVPRSHHRAQAKAASP